MPARPAPPCPALPLFALPHLSMPCPALLDMSSCARMCECAGSAGLWPELHVRLHHPLPPGLACPSSWGKRLSLCASTQGLILRCEATVIYAARFMFLIQGLDKFSLFHSCLPSHPNSHSTTCEQQHRCQALMHRVWS